MAAYTSCSKFEFLQESTLKFHHSNYNDGLKKYFRARGHENSYVQLKKIGKKAYTMNFIAEKLPENISDSL